MRRNILSFVFVVALFASIEGQYGDADDPTRHKVAQQANPGLFMRGPDEPNEGEDDIEWSAADLAGLIKPTPRSNSSQTPETPPDQRAHNDEAEVSEEHGT